MKPRKKISYCGLSLVGWYPVTLGHEDGSRIFVEAQGNTKPTTLRHIPEQPNAQVFPLWKPQHS